MALTRDVNEAVEPRRAAALIVVDTSTPAEVLLARRNESLAFMGGQYCFPGGRIHEDEGTANVLPGLPDDTAEALHAAVRETFEETGLLCVEGILPSPDILRAARQATIVSPTMFDPLLRQYDLTIDPSRFEPAGVWVTPPISPIRFSTNYFLYQYRRTKDEEIFYGEIVDLEWMTPATARRRWRSGKIDTSTPVGFALGRLATVAPEQWAAALRDVPVTPAGIPGRFELRWGIYLIPVRSDTLPPATHTNCVVIGEEEVVVIDPGARDTDECALLLDQVRHITGDALRVRAILLTHHHPDHAAGAAFLRDALACPVWGHEATDGQLGFALDRYLSDGDTIDLPGDPPWRLECIYTPGHSSDHLCYLEESTGTLIAGDMIANPGSIYISPDDGGDMTAYLNSLEALKDKPVLRIVPGHGIPVQDDAKRLIQQHVDHRLWRERRIRKAIEAGESDYDQLLREVYDDVDESVLPLAEGNFRAHLARLTGIPKIHRNVSE